MKGDEGQIIATDLEFVPLASVLQQLATNRVNAKVTVTRREGEGVILLRDGKIIYAASNSAREAVGNLLLTQGLVTVSALEDALAIQGRSKADRRLGSILVELGAVDVADIRRVVYTQVARVLRELFQWRHGFVKVRPMTIADGGEVEVDAEEFLLQDGLPVDRVVLEALAKGLDRLDTPVALDLADLGSGAWSLSDLDSRELADATSPRGLREVLREIRSTTVTGEISLSILRYAERCFARGILFAHGAGELYGTGHFGISGAEVSQRVRALKIPSHEPSVLLEALELRSTYRGPLEGNYWNRELIRALGGIHPRDVASLPVMVADQVALVLYGDDAGGAHPNTGLDELELLLDQSGLALEKIRYERAATELKRKLGARSDSPRAEAERFE